MLRGVVVSALYWLESLGKIQSFELYEAIFDRFSHFLGEFCFFCLYLALACSSAGQFAFTNLPRFLLNFFLQVTLQK